MKCSACKKDVTPVRVGTHRLMVGDSRDPASWLQLMGGGRVNVLVTSPPYASQRTYDESSGFKPVPPDEYVEWFRPLAALIADHLAPDGSFFLNIKEHCDDGQRSLYVKDLTLAHVREWAWRLVDEFCWRNTRNGVPGGWNNRFKNAWEPVFHFTRGESIKFRPGSVSTKSDGVFDYQPGQTTKTGSGLLANQGKREGMARPSNVVDVPAEVGQGDHAAPYPLGLVDFFVRAFSDEDDVVLDPFMGSGTTMIAAAKNGRRGFGFEISPGYADVIRRRVTAFLRSSNMEVGTGALE